MPEYTQRRLETSAHGQLYSLRTSIFIPGEFIIYLCIVEQTIKERKKHLKNGLKYKGVAYPKLMRSF